MIDRDKVFDAFRNCITEPKCKDCPWEQCEQFNQKKVDIPVTLALDVIELLKEQGTVNLYKCQNCGTWVSAENVVWCKDCKHAGEDCEIAFHFGEKDDWFCADGERKEGR
jgi:hypothetical protein